MRDQFFGELSVLARRQLKYHVAMQTHITTRSFEKSSLCIACQGMWCIWALNIFLHFRQRRLFLSPIHHAAQQVYTSLARYIGPQENAIQIIQIKIFMCTALLNKTQTIANFMLILLCCKVLYYDSFNYCCVTQTLPL